MEIPPKKVTFLSGFPEDRRISMEVYRRGLIDAIRTIDAANIDVTEFIPRKIGSNNGRWSMRVARYFSYPRQLPVQSEGIFHILDPGYGHLLRGLRRKRTVVTVHDLIPLLRWKGNIEGIKPDHIPFLNQYSYNSLSLSAEIIAVSENTKNDLVSNLKIDPARVSVVPYGINSEFFRDQIPSSLNVLPAREELSVKRILISGSQFYKNNETSLKVFMELKSLYHDQVCLVKIGNPTSEWNDMVMQFHLQGQIIELGPLNQNRLASLYREVDVLLFPSFYEGFGLPPLEAMASGTPVVISNRASLPEVTGGLAPSCDPKDIAAYVKQITRILSDIEYRQMLIQNGKDFARKFTWNEAAMKTIAVYEKVLR